MKALYICSVPCDIETLKTKDAQNTTVMGAAIYRSEAFAAILRYSTYDRILLPNTTHLANGDYRDSTLFRDNTKRLVFVGEHELDVLARFEEIVICHLGWYLSEAARVRRLSGSGRIPITGVIHALNYPSVLLLTFAMLAESLQPYDALICSSEAGRTALSSILALLTNRIEMTGATGFEPQFQLPLIPLGVDAHAFSGNYIEDLRASMEVDDDPIILYYGRFSEQSKADLIPLLLAFSQLLESNIKAWLLLAGDDSQCRLRERLLATATTLGCSSRVRVLANPDRLLKRQIYESADIFVAPSDNLQETFGITVLEAMAAKLPVVGADWDGFRDTIVDGETGYLIPTLMPLYPAGFDAIASTGAMDSENLLAATTTVDLEALRNALKALICDPSKRRQFGLAGRRRVERLYDWRVIIRSYELLWHRLSIMAHDDGLDNINPLLDLTIYNYRTIFRQYASAVISDDTKVQITNSGMACLRDNRPPLSIIESANGCFTPDETRPLLEMLAASEAMRVRDLMSMYTETDERARGMIMAAVCRLIKYGFAKPSNHHKQC